jgi:hypothetical protein
VTRGRAHPNGKSMFIAFNKGKPSAGRTWTEAPFLTASLRVSMIKARQATRCVIFAEAVTGLGR